MISLVQTISASFFSFVLWSIVRIFVRRSPLSIVPGPPKASWWKGNFMKVFDRQAWNYHLELAKRYGGACRINSFFGNEQLYVFDPLALHHIFVKQQYVFEETEVFVVQNGLVFGQSLLSTLGEHHRRQRKMLNPVFSLKHMRDLIPIFYPIANQLRTVLTNKIRSGQEEINVMKWLSRAALEYIAQGGLGYTFNALDESEKNRDSYSEVIKMYGPITFSLRIVRQALPYLVKLGTPRLRRRFMELVPSKLLQQARHIVDTMDRTSNMIFEEKKRALSEGEEAVVRQVGKGKDIMSILLRANMAADEKERLPEAEILGQMNAFIFAGHDTTTSAVSRLLHILALNQDVQSRLRKEITEARDAARERGRRKREEGAGKEGEGSDNDVVVDEADGELDYDTLMGLPYLDAVVRETMRVYPPVPTVVRTTRADTTLPLQWPIRAEPSSPSSSSSSASSTYIRSIPLKSNTGIIISILNANRDPRIWGPDAHEWKPERWLGADAPGAGIGANGVTDGEGKVRVPGVYSGMMTFIGGGRACIGFKFAEMEMKLVISVLLESFIFSPGKDEIYWNMGPLQSPVVKGSGDISPQLPLKVELVQRETES